MHLHNPFFLKSGDNLEILRILSMILLSIMVYFRMPVISVFQFFKYRYVRYGFKQQDAFFYFEGISFKNLLNGIGAVQNSLADFHQSFLKDGVCKVSQRLFLSFYSIEFGGITSMYYDAWKNVPDPVRGFLPSTDFLQCLIIRMLLCLQETV